MEKHLPSATQAKSIFATRLLHKPANPAYEIVQNIIFQVHFQSVHDLYELVLHFF